MSPRIQYEDLGAASGFRPILRPKHRKLQCFRHFALYGPIREPSVPYNWTCGAFGTCGPLWSQPGPGEVFFETPRLPRGGARRIPVASRKPARAEEEDMCMDLFTMFFRLVSHVILFGFPTVPLVVPRMSTHLFSSPSAPLPMASYGILFPECPSSSTPNVPYFAFTLVFSGFPECPQCTLWAPPGGSPGASRGLSGSSWGHRSPKWLQDCFPMPLQELFRDQKNRLRRS